MTLRLDRHDGVAVITLDAPERRNALTVELSAELAKTVDKCAHDDSVHALVVTGTPPAFCAGADLTQLGKSREDGLRKIYAGFLAVARCPLPTIAAVGGAAVGAGLNLALAADVRIAGPQARFDARFVQLGIHPGGGMTWMLQRAVGPQAAKAMTLFQHIPDAEEALRLGLTFTTVPGTHEDLVAAAVQLAAPTRQVPRKLLCSVKRTMRTTGVQDDHVDAIEKELVAQVESMETPEFAQLLSAMRAKVGSQR